MKNIIAREAEVAWLEKAFVSKEAEFLAIYGRRRIGKTFLVNQFFTAKKCHFISVTGLKDGSLKEQLAIFARSMGEAFYQGVRLEACDNWMDAFHFLTDEMKKISTTKKIVLFLDELPWLASSKSGCIQALDHIWNTQWSLMSNVKLIVCGSAASWMLDNVIKAKGGLHNRVTHSLKLKPFTLLQTKTFLKTLGYKLSNKQVLDFYMLTGGVPLYLKKIQKGRSVSQNIQALCFSEDAFMQGEFEQIFRSLFKHADAMQEIVEVLAQNRYGLSRKKLLSKISQSSGGTFAKRMDSLEASGFVEKYIPYGLKRDVYYRVIDEYTFFYMKWIKTNRTNRFTDSHWHDQVKTPSFISWAGYTFESICLKHFNEIRRALGIANVGCKIGNWRLVTGRSRNEVGAQIDLLYDRDDEAITLCDMKYSQKAYVLTKEEAKKLDNRVSQFVEATKTSKQIFLAIITTCGLKRNFWSEDLIDSVVSLDDLLGEF